MSVYFLLIFSPSVCDRSKTICRKSNFVSLACHVTYLLQNVVLAFAAQHCDTEVNRGSAAEAK